MGADREPDQVANISMFGRIFITSMIVYNIGVYESASRYDLWKNYVNFLIEIPMDNEAENTDQNRTDFLLEELYSGNIVAGGHSTFGKFRGFNRDKNPHAVCIFEIRVAILVLI